MNVYGKNKVGPKWMRKERREERDCLYLYIDLVLEYSWFQVLTRGDHSQALIPHITSTCL